MARKVQYEPFVGRREQYEYVDSNKKLSAFSEYLDLGDVINGYSNQQLSRIEMMDCVWLQKGRITAIFEVENSTNFVDAVSRASNIEADIPKFMIIPKERLQELLKYKDALFVDSFRSQSWRYMTFDDVRKLVASRTINIDDIKALSNTL